MQTVCSDSSICSSKVFILASKTSGVSAPNIMDDNPLNEKPLGLGGVSPLSAADYRRENDRVHNDVTGLSF